MNLMMLDFFDAIQTFYGWAFPLNVMVTAGILVGLTVGLLPQRGSLLRRMLPAVCVCVMLAAEILWQLFCSEHLAVFCALGWMAEAALLSAAVGLLIRAAWTALRRR